MFFSLQIWAVDIYKKKKKKICLIFSFFFALLPVLPTWPHSWVPLPGAAAACLRGGWGAHPRDDSLCWEVAAETVLDGLPGLLWEKLSGQSVPLQLVRLSATVLSLISPANISVLVHVCAKALRAHLPEFYSLTFHVNALVLFLVLALFFEILFFTAWGRKDCWRTTKMKVDPSIWQVSQAGEHRIDNSRAWIFGVLILCEGWDILQLSLRYAGWRIMHIVLEYF